jgi:hypothetical protein
MDKQMKEDIDFLEIVYQIFPSNYVKDVKIRQELIKFHFEKES